jgi:uncharacterized protein CbrC (UPF0167 family)
MDLPHFKYHPEPLVSGSIKLSKNPCACCGRKSGYIYTGPVYAEAELDDQLCPWCIADGSAHAKFDADFCDIAAIGDGSWDAVPEAVLHEVAYRTPGFNGWQQERWFTHCGDAGAFLGVAGFDELTVYGPEAVAAIASESDLDEDEVEEYIQSLDALDQPAAYLFRCIHCQKYGGYSDRT